LLTRLTCRFLILIATDATNVTATRAQIYQNAEFGITVPAPKSTLLCPPPSDKHDHGPVFLLGTSDPKNCGDSAHSRSIVIFASYNAADATKKLADFLKWECAGPCGPAPPGLHIAELPIASAKAGRSDGWIDVIVVTQAGKPDPAFDPSVPLINYDLTLHTRQSSLNEDLRAFHMVLQTVRLRPVR
jgi:hypothetical protein